MNLIGVREAAKQLDIHPETLRRNARSGDIPGAKVGLQWKFDPDVLREFVANGGNKLNHQESEQDATATAEF